ncbi:MAG: tetratricopeptide repeat protein [Bacteroidales bacterium]|nr:tetratricopeptide repeat protein [Bacteroidales bacterium]
MRFKTFYATFLVTALLGSGTMARAVSPQGSLRRPDPFARAEAFFGAGQYAPAQHLLSETLAGRDTTRLNYQDAVFYDAASALLTGQPDGPARMEDFLNRYPDHPLCVYARYYLASENYREEHFDEAVRWLDQVDIDLLRPEDRDACLYKLGYACRMTGDRDRARALFGRVAGGTSIYAEDAQLYMAIADYEAGRYEEALSGLAKLEGSPLYGTAAAYYVAHVYFDQGRFQDVVDYTHDLIITDLNYQAGLYRVVAASHSRLKDYRRAAIYWDAFEKTEGMVPTAADQYEIGFTYYALKQYAKAMPYLEKAAADTTVVGQHAAYHLAGCYLAEDAKPKALAAFHVAGQSDADTLLQEDALFHEAVLTYELSYAPFSEIIRRFTDYLAKYPDSPHARQVYNYLVTAYGETKNYAAALETLEHADLGVDYVAAAYQRVAFFRAVECFDAHDYATAASLLRQSLEYGRHDSRLASQACFWMAETLAADGNPKEAVTYYKRFLADDSVRDLQEYPYASYGLGYSYFAMNAYDAAATWFNQFAAAIPADEPAWGDARNRIGDCLFMRKEYLQAIAAYREVSEKRMADADYALFQQGFCQGLLGNHQSKIATLGRLLADYPDSDYADDALYETGRACMAGQRMAEAITWYEKVISDYPNSSYVSKALSQLGLACYNRNDAESAMKYYKRVVDEFPNSPEARSALIGIRTIYMDREDADSYFEYARSLEHQQVNLTVTEQDSLTYSVAERMYMDGRTEAAREALGRYLERWPEGAFALSAHYYLGSCCRQAGDLEAAVQHYRRVADAPRSLYSEQAVSELAQLLYEQNNDEEALKYYTQLSALAELPENMTAARLGILRTEFRLKHYEEVLRAADAVTAMQKATPAQVREARFKAASSHLAQKDTTAALALFRRLSEEALSAEGAEANFRTVDLLYATKKYKDAEQAVFDFAGKNTSQTYWTARSFIRLAEVYIATDDLFQASNTIQSVLDNYAVKDDGVLEEARKVKARIDALQPEENKQP